MTTLLLLIVINIILAGLFYGVFAFYEVKLYFGDWSSGSRAGFLTLYVCFAFMVNIIGGMSHINKDGKL